MTERARKRRDFIQNMTIVLLTISAVFLFARTQRVSLGTGVLPFLSGGDLPASVQSAGENPALVSPVRAVVSGAFGRYGSITLTTASEDFEPLRALLAQALDGTGHYTAGRSSLFLDALSGTSVYYDFLNPLPLSVLSGILQSHAELEEDTLSPRRLLVAERGTGVALYLWDESGQCYWGDTTLPREVLEETVSLYELGGASFAFEDPRAASIAPCSLFLDPLPELPRLTVTVPLSDTSLILTRLGFNPNTQNRYVDGSGAEVVMEGSRSLRIHSDGTIVYQSGQDGSLTIPSAGEVPTRLEAARETAALLGELLSASSGDASLYLESVRQVGGASVLKFGYQVNGIPVRFADGKSAAQVSLSGSSISSITLRVRQYAGSGERTLLLPLRQALAIAARESGAELFLGYAEGGDGVASAKWLAE